MNELSIVSSSVGRLAMHYLTTHLLWLNIRPETSLYKALLLCVFESMIYFTQILKLTLK